MAKGTHLIVLLHRILPNPLFVFLQELTLHRLLTNRAGKWLGLFSWSHDNEHGSQFPLKFRLLLGDRQFTSKRSVCTALAFQIADIVNPVLRKISQFLELEIKRSTHIQGGEPAS